LRLLQAVGSWAVHLLGRVTAPAEGLIPPAGPVLLAMNHQSLWDGPLLCGLTRRPVACLVKAEAFKPVLGRALHRAGQIPIHRERVDPGPVHLCLDVLRAGGIVGIFPEGTRGAGDVRSARPGVGYFALRSGACVIPVAAHGTTNLIHGWRRAPVTVAIGAPITFSRVPDHRPLSRRDVAAATEVVRVALAQLVRAGRAAGPQPVRFLPD
jgi:1-acyl-sn-glycerol-3-phosphate acyltransferase